MKDAYEYQPTAIELKLIEVLINPDHSRKTIAQKCKMAGTTRQRYYEAMKKPEFTKLLNQMSRDIIGNKIYDVLNATYLHAKGERGHSDRKMLLTMYGLYADKMETTHHGSMNLSMEAGQLTDAEVQKQIQELERELKLNEPES